MAGALIEIHSPLAMIEVSSGRIGMKGRPFTFLMTPVVGAAASNQTCVIIQAQDVLGLSAAVVTNVDIWLSDSTAGAGLTATTASGAVANGGGAGATPVTAAGADIGTQTAKKALQVQTDATGRYTLSIVDAAKTAFKVCAKAPDGTTIVGVTLATANYG